MNKPGRGDGVVAKLFKILETLLLRCLLSVTVNVKNSPVATGLEKVSFHSNPQNRSMLKMFKLLYSCTHLKY